MEKHKILVVDDESVVRESLSEWLTDAGYEVLTASDSISALKLIQNNKIDILVADLKMPQIDGIELMKRAKKIDPNLPVIIMTAYASIESAVLATKEGAYDYLEKPFCPERVEILIQKLLAHQDVIKENIALKRKLEKRFQFSDLIGKSHKMEQVFELIRTVAKSNATVLIQGETGTGKELVARAIHAASNRKSGPFIPVNCANLPETLLESELFGHEKGSFTGAIAQKKGKFEIAHQGSLLLDEIGDVSLNFQLHLLRVIERKEFTRVGGNQVIKVDVRIISSTNKDLKKAIEQKQFREDLYYRLNVVTIHLPPLRERTEDIPVLAQYFLRKYNTENNKNIIGFSPKVMEFFMNYRWPGNVRELENAIEHSLVVAKDELIQLDNLPVLIRKSSAKEAFPLTTDKTLAELEKEYIIKVLKENNGNRARTARILGIERTTLYNKIKSYEIDVNK
jgi:two-component system response regulator AtoC